MIYRLTVKLSSKATVRTKKWSEEEGMGGVKYEGEQVAADGGGNDVLAVRKRTARLGRVRTARD